MEKKSLLDRPPVYLPQAVTLQPPLVHYISIHSSGISVYTNVGRTLTKESCRDMRVRKLKCCRVAVGR
jgi:hypothetical protein